MEDRYYDPEIETATRDEITRLQEEKLKAIVQHAWDQSPFYRKKFEEANITLDKIRSIEDISLLPFITKEDLREDQKESPPWGGMLTLPLEECQRLHQTSGTTGQPLRVADTAEDWSKFCHMHARMLYAYGVRKTDMVMPAFGFGPFIGFWASYYAAEEIGCTLFATGGFKTEQRINTLVSYPITAMGSTPSYALYMAEEAKKMGVDLRKDAKIRITWHTGEPGGGIPSVVKKIEDAYGCKAFDFIGSTEIGPWGFNCEFQSGLTHINEDWAYLEVLDFQTGEPVGPGGTGELTGEPVGPGGTGELILTNLERRAHPFLRYRTRDIVKVAERDCPCGRTLFSLEGSVLGRLDDMKKIRGIIVYPSRIEEIVREFEEVDEFQMVFTRVEGLDEIIVKIDPVPGMEPGSFGEFQSKVEKALQMGLGIRASVEILEHGTLPRWDHKAKRILDERKDIPF
jgi:phenylacetate-CoA ligase